MTDLVVLSLERWDAVWRRNQYLVAGLIDADPDMRVLFVEPAADPLHDLRSGRSPELGHGIRQLDERLWTFRSTKWLPRRLDPHGDARRTTSVRDAARRQGFSRPVLWVNDPTAAPIIRMTGWPSLYDITDDWLSAERPAAELARIATGERFLLEHADAVVACSPELVRRKRSAREEIHLIPNAVDVDAYRRTHERPGTLPTGPVALYLGTLHRDRLDVELCARAAEELRGHAAVVLAGPDLLTAADRASLDAAGVHRIGAIERHEIPGLLQHADVLLVPHLVNAFTDSLDPIKLYEYQAAGRPVVSTDVAGFRDAADARVRIANAARFTEAIRAALSEPVPGSAATAPDWRVRVNQMRRVLDAIG